MLVRVQAAFLMDWDQTKNGHWNSHGSTFKRTRETKECYMFTNNVTNWSVLWQSSTTIWMPSCLYSGRKKLVQHVFLLSTLIAWSHPRLIIDVLWFVSIHFQSGFCIDADHLKRRSCQVTFTPRQYFHNVAGCFQVLSWCQLSWWVLPNTTMMPTKGPSSLENKGN